VIPHCGWVIWTYDTLHAFHEWPFFRAPLLLPVPIWLVVLEHVFSPWYWECHHPNWFIFFFRGVGGSTTNQLCRYVLRPWSRRRVAKEKFWKWLWGAKNHGEQWWLLLSIGVGVKIFGIEYWGQPLLQCFLIQPQTNSVDWCHKHQSVKHVQLMLIEVGMSLHLSKRFSNYMIFRWENIVCSQTGVDV